MIKILNSREVSRDEIFARVTPSFNVEEIVTDIIANVRKNGDAALYEYAEKFDKVKLTSLEVTEEEIAEAFSLVEPDFIRILEDAVKNIRAFHEKQVRKSFIMEN